ncbi:hypothetical protein [Paenibacillus tarimensis]|uniref:hypothetical protein n=1 Tax=Paenibacillus tarimensis TaxID=416012 RepID=UPI001F3E7D54|nr:hypothetical protein [Paenibacillus tarimensis]MCF2943473.1 hypothetical protein [Paenibacillus tarimensis]
MRVIVYEKRTGGELVTIDERRWSGLMIASLEHANYITIGGREYETVEGRLNVDHETFELLVVPMQG